ncbi:hypothetical protein F5887DRAFT_918466 [Amanita rubescens]|nr:hypothetical protein F5887DRAFT_918466 [Amanita rubescens]
MSRCITFVIVEFSLSSIIRSGLTTQNFNHVDSLFSHIFHILALASGSFENNWRQSGVRTMLGCLVRILALASGSFNNKLEAVSTMETSCSSLTTQTCNHIDSLLSRISLTSGSFENKLEAVSVGTSSHISLGSGSFENKIRTVSGPLAQFSSLKSKPFLAAVRNLMDVNHPFKRRSRGRERRTTAVTSSISDPQTKSITTTSSTIYFTQIVTINLIISSVPA